MPTTPDPRFGVSVDVLSDGPPDGPHVFLDQIVTPIVTQAAIDDQGTFALRPVSTPGTPGIRGRYYMVIGDADATKNGILWRDNGTGWDAIAFGSIDLDFNTRTSPLVVTPQTEGGAAIVVNGHSIAYAGGRVKVEVWLPYVHGGGENFSADLFGVVYRDSTAIGHSFLGRQDSRGIQIQGNQTVQAFDTPSAANHVYSFRAYKAGDSPGSVTFTIEAGAGGSGNYLPAFLRVLKAS